MLPVVEAEGVERACLRHFRIFTQKRLHAVAHFLCGSAGKGEGENASGPFAFFDESGNAAHESLRLACSRSGENKHRPWACLDGFLLCRVVGKLFGFIFYRTENGQTGQGRVLVRVFSGAGDVGFFLFGFWNGNKGCAVLDFGSFFFIENSNHAVFTVKPGLRMTLPSRMRARPSPR